MRTTAVGHTGSVFLGFLDKLSLSTCRIMLDQERTFRLESQLLNGKFFQPRAHNPLGYGTDR